MKSNSKDIHFFLLQYFSWMGWKGVAEPFLTAPLSSAELTQRRHPQHSSPLTQYRQDLATLQAFLGSFLAFDSAFNGGVRHPQYTV